MQASFINTITEGITEVRLCSYESLILSNNKASLLPISLIRDINQDGEHACSSHSKEFNSNLVQRLVPGQRKDRDNLKSTVHKNQLYVPNVLY
jgi:hypothetical protein